MSDEAFADGTEWSDLSDELLMNMLDPGHTTGPRREKARSEVLRRLRERQDPQVFEVTEEIEEWGVRGSSPGATLRSMWGVELKVETTDGWWEAYGEADSRSVARAKAWESIIPDLVATTESDNLKAVVGDTVGQKSSDAIQARMSWRPEFCERHLEYVLRRLEEGTPLRNVWYWPSDALGRSSFRDVLLMGLAMVRRMQEDPEKASDCQGRIRLARGLGIDTDKAVEAVWHDIENRVGGLLDRLREIRDILKGPRIFQSERLERIWALTDLSPSEDRNPDEQAAHEIAQGERPARGSIQNGED